MPEQENGSRSAKILYRPVGMVSSIISGVVAGAIFKQIWKKASRSGSKDAPKALESEFGLGEVLAAAAIQGAVFAGVKALVDRGGARLFQRATGEWPGN